MRRRVVSQAVGVVVVWIALLPCATAEHHVTGNFNASSLERPTSWALRWEQATHTGPSTPFELNWRTGLSLVLAAVCALLANAAGIGGGPFYIPLFNSLLGFNLKAATALSHTVVATSAVASTLYGFWQTSPNDSNRTLVDFDIALCFLPAILFGVSFGVLTNVLVPDWFQTALLTCILCFVIKHTVHKGLSQWRKEQEGVSRRASREEGASQPAPELQPKLEDSSLSELLVEHGNEAEAYVLVKDADGILHEEKFVTYNDRAPSRRRSFVEEVVELKNEIRSELSGISAWWQRFPLKQVVLVLLLWAVFLAIQETKTWYPRCTWENTANYAVQITGLLLVTIAAVSYQIRKHQTRPQDVDPELRKILEEGADKGQGHVLQNFATVAAVMALSGFLAGFLGIGGALIFNPYLLALGVHPQVTASTSVMMILFSSSAIALSLGFQGLLNEHYARVFAPLAFVSSLVGVTIINRVVRSSGRSSIIVFILVGLIIVGTITTAIFGGLRAYEDFSTGENIYFRSFCSQ